MFSRASNAAHICLRCRSRLLTTERIVHSTPFLLHLPSHRRRYQSAAAVQVDDEDVPISTEHSDHKGGPTKNEITTKKKSKKRKLSSLWRPNQTAELGMDALGKPSEVLLLSPRDRKIPLVPDDSSEEPRESFYESVASEKQPATWDQIKENIAQAHLQTQPQRGLLTPEAWAKLKKLLTSGFTQNQLLRYLAEASPSEPVSKKRIKAIGKESIIKLIARRIWKYELPLQSSNSTQQGIHSPTPKTIYLAPLTNEQQILVDRNPTVDLRKTATEYGVTINFEPKRTVLSGPADGVTEVATALKAHISSIKKTRLTVDAYPRLYSDKAEEDNLQILVETIARKYGVHAAIKKQHSGWRLNVACTANNQSSAQRLQHEICLALECQRQKVPFMTDTTLDEGLVLIPAYSPDLSSIYPYPRHCHRAQPLKLSKEDVPFKPFSASVHKHLLLPTPHTEKLSHHRVEYTAEFTVVLFDNSDTVSPEGISSKDLTNSKLGPAFHSTIPLLPQLLTSRSVRQTKRTKPASFTARLRFQPVSPEPSGRLIEVDVAGDDPQTGLTQQLRIDRISISDAESRLDLLQPFLPVDLKLSCRNSTSIYDSSSPQDSDLFTVLSKYLDGNLIASNPKETNEQRVPPPSVPLFVDLPLPVEVHTRSSKSKKKKSPIVNSTVQIRNSAYFLYDFSIIETDIYEFDLNGNRYALEHINYIAQNPNIDPRNPAQGHVMPSPFRDRQALVLRRNCTPKTVKGGQSTVSEGSEMVKEGRKTEKARFFDFLMGATWVSKQVGKEANALKQRMVRMK